jgi:peptide/nickel transport system substrate-binding protein
MHSSNPSHTRPKEFPVTRRSLRHLLLAMVAALGLLAVACGGSSDSKADSSSSSATAASGSKALNIAFTADMQVPDPDIFYELEGNQVVTSVYEGLVAYKPNSTEIEGALADSWTVSPDGLTYTFKLKPDVKFQDGTPMDSTAWAESFKRRTDVNSAPAYMLADVASTATPDPQTFVVTLKQPVSPFLDYMAAPYGPKAVSPTVLKAQGGSDFAQSYLKDHSAGTGPYYISKFEPGTGYELTRNDNYWGGKPYFEKVNIAIIPEMSTQRLKLEGGELDMIIHGLPVADVDSFKKNADFTVNEFPVLLKTALAANPNKGPFADQDLRLALQSAIDKPKLVKEIYKGQAKPSTQIYPAGMMADGKAMDPDTVDTQKLKDAVAKLPADKRKVDFAYSEDEGGTIPRLAETVQTTLAAAGLEVTVRAMPIAEVFDLVNNKDTAPDLLLWTMNPDAAHPDTWIRIFMSTAGALNYLQCSVPEADTQMDEGLKSTDPAQVTDLYGQAGDTVVASGCYTTLADNQEIVVARKGITGFVHQLPTSYTVRLKDLKEG